MILDFLDLNQIPYQKVDHPPVYTCEEARLIVPALPGAETKNLFLRDDKGRKHYLLVMSADKNADLKALGMQLGIKGLGFASAERLKKYLGLEPGSVSLLGIINDREGFVEVIIDQDLWQADAILCHPLVNTSTLSISMESVKKFLDLTKHQAGMPAIAAKA